MSDNKKKQQFIILLVLVVVSTGVYFFPKREADLPYFLKGLFKSPAPPVVLNMATIEDGYPAALPDSEPVLKYKGFHLSYNEQYEQASWTAYILTRRKVEQGKVYRTNNFRPDTNISTGSASLADYRNSGYDRGHLAPAGDMKWDKGAMSESFLLSNMSPQVPAFNRNIWKRLETKVRNWAVANDSIYVVTGPVLNHIEKTIGSNHVGVPDYYFKVILDISSPAYKGIAFLIKNEASGEDIIHYAISIDSLEQFLHYDFFPNQDSYSIEKVESNLDLSKWQ